MVSLDDLNDWAQGAAELEWLVEQIRDAVLNLHAFKEPYKGFVEY